MNSLSEASSITALTWPSNSTGSTMTVRGGAVTSPDWIWIDRCGTSLDQDALPLDRALADQALAERVRRGVLASVRVGIARELRSAVLARSSRP